MWTELRAYYTNLKIKAKGRHNIFQEQAQEGGRGKGEGEKSESSGDSCSSDRTVGGWVAKLPPE